MTITLNALQKQRRDTASNWTTNNTVLLAGELGYETDTKKFKIGDGTTTWQSLDYLPIPDTNRLLAGNLTVGGNFQVNGTTTTIDTTTLTVEDKNIEIGKVSSPSDTTADGGGITLKAASDKTITWSNANDSWDFNQNINAASTYAYKINNVSVLNATTLGNSVVSSSLTSVGTITSGVWNGTAITKSNLASLDIVNADVNASAAIAGSKISPDFGSQNITTTGNLSATETTSSDIFLGDSILHTGDTNTKIRFPSNDAFAVETGGNERFRVNDTGVGIGTISPVKLLDIATATSADGIRVRSTGNTYNELSFDANRTSAGTHIGRIISHWNGTAVSYISMDAGSDTTNKDDGMIRFWTADGAGNFERLRIDSNGKIGIGTTSPTEKLDVEGSIRCNTGTDIDMDSSASGQVRFRGNGYTGAIALNDDAMHIYSNASARDLVFGVNSSEKMRIDTSGHVLFNCTSLPSSSVAGAGFEKNGSQAILFSSSGSSTASSNHAEFLNGNGVVGTINTNGSATSYNTSSDYRLKENATAISDGITRLKTLKPYRFNFKADASTTVDGFFAHEVTAVPEAISGTKDAVATKDSEQAKKGDPIYQQIDQSKLVPLLTAALQEAIAKIEVLETKVAALETA